MTSRGRVTGKLASRHTDRRTGDPGDWREETLARMRALILAADPEMIEERKWRKPSNAMAGVPVWSHDGIVCTGETYTKLVKLTFARGARVPDPSRLFNSSLGGTTRRAIDIHEGEKVDPGAFKALVKAAVAQNGAPAKKPKTGAWATNAATGSARTIHHKDGSIYARGQMLGGKMHGYWEFFRKDGTIMRSGSFDREQQVGTWTTYAASGKLIKVTEMKAGARARPRASEARPIKMRTGEEVVLLSGGNPQIAKADGDAPVQAYIAAMPGWKSDIGKRLDALIVRNVPGVRKAVRWNTPFYGIEGQGWFLGFHVFTRYVKVAFFRGSSLRPVPPGASKDENTRYLDIHESDEFDEARMATWVKQAAALPGWVFGRPS